MTAFKAPSIDINGKRKNLVPKNFYLLPEPERKTITDSLLLPSGITVLKGTIAGYTITVVTQGYVNISWKGENYHQRQDFPDELVETIKKRELDSNPDAEIIENNWYELMVHDKKGRLLHSDCIDLDLNDLTEEDAKRLLAEEAVEWNGPSETKVCTSGLISNDTRKLHTLTCKSSKENVTVFLVHYPEKQYFWYAIEGSHFAHLVNGKPFKSGKQLNDVHDEDCFTYYGEGSRPDNIKDMETLLWLLRDKSTSAPTEDKHPYNPFNIPDLDPMLESVTEWVREHQGDKGFILTDNSDNDTIWAILYSEEDGYAIEAEVKAVRVSEYGKLEAMCDTSSVTYNDEWVKEAENPNKSLFHSWLDLKWDENLYFIPTIFNIAENIREYA